MGGREGVLFIVLVIAKGREPVARDNPARDIQFACVGAWVGGGGVLLLVDLWRGLLPLGPGVLLRGGKVCGCGGLWRRDVGLCGLCRRVRAVVVALVGGLHGAGGWLQRCRLEWVLRWDAALELRHGDWVDWADPCGGAGPVRGLDRRCILW